jgi:hypothetical protein
MEWPLPIAEAQPSIMSESNHYISSVEAYASIDRTFAVDLEHGEYLKTVLQDLKEGVDRHEVAFQSAKHSIVRGFLARADFAAEQKILVLQCKMKEALKNNDKNKLNLLQADANEIENEVKCTLEIVQHFQKIMSPRLDLSVETLKVLRDNVKLPTFYYDECLSETDEEDSHS